MAIVSIKSCAAEFIGTFLLIFTVGCNVLSDNGTWAAVSIACVLMVSIYAFGAVSGANFNPAVSFALGLANKMEGGWAQVGVYSAVQCVAALFAAICYSLLFGGGFAITPMPGLTVGAIMCEFFYTFMLCFVVLNVAASKKLAGKNQFYGLAIGFVIIAGGYASGPLGAGCFNPAVALGITASGLGKGALWFLIYVVAEIAGAAAAVGAFKFLRPEEAEPGAATELKHQLVAEALGTFMLVLTVGLNVLGSSPAAAFSIAASLTCMICAIGDISGGHFNPAVTIAFLCCGKPGDVDPKKAAHYAAAQVGGAILAGICYTLAHAGNTFPLGPGFAHGWAGALFVELIFTFVLAGVVLCVANHDKGVPSEFVGLIVGSCVTVGDRKSVV